MDLKVGRFTGQAVQDLLGKQVSRATATLPQSTTGDLFTVTGGLVRLNAIYGIVTTAIQNQANNTKLISTPASGSAVDMCAVLDIANDEAGCLYTVTGLPSDALYGPNAGLGQWTYRPLILPVGSIKLSCAASNTGSVRWVAWYTPLEPGAALKAA